ncbi:MAG: hypothetical protein V1820_06435 [archaeon]
MRRSRSAQLAIEFVASAMIFLFATMLVVSAVFRGYLSVSDSAKTALLETKAQKVVTELSASSSNGFAEGDGSLNYTKLMEIPEGNYSALRERVRIKEDYNFRISFLPSIVIGTYFENPLAKAPGEAAFSFDTFSNSTPINVTIIPRAFDGRIPSGRTYALLVNSSDSLIDSRETDPSGRVSLVPAGEGVYTLFIFSYDKVERLYGTREISVGVVSS